MLLHFQLCSSPFCLWAAHGRMPFGFRALRVFFIFKTLFVFNGDDPFPRSIFSVLGRSQQQGKTIIKIKAKIVQFSLWKEAVPRRPAQDACTQVKAGGRGVLVFLQLSRCSRGLAQEGIFRMVRRM